MYFAIWTNPFHNLDKYIFPFDKHIPPVFLWMWIFSGYYNYISVLSAAAAKVVMQNFEIWTNPFLIWTNTFYNQDKYSSLSRQTKFIKYILQYDKHILVDIFWILSVPSPAGAKVFMQNPALPSFQSNFKEILGAAIRSKT